MDNKYREAVLSRINNLRNCLERADDIETANICCIRSSEALTSAMQLVDMQELKDENKRLRESLDKIKNIKQGRNRRILCN